MIGNLTWANYLSDSVTLSSRFYWELCDQLQCSLTDIYNKYRCAKNVSVSRISITCQLLTDIMKAKRNNGASQHHICIKCVCSYRACTVQYVYSLNHYLSETLPPDTGASMNTAPIFSAATAISLETAGSMVEESISRVPFFIFLQKTHRFMREVKPRLCVCTLNSLNLIHVTNDPNRGLW